jgi:hypothetical protein
MGGIFAVSRIFSKIEGVYRAYVYFSVNRVKVKSAFNLAQYKNVSKYLFKDLPSYRVFKEWDDAVNKLYWRVKTRDGSYFYTDSDNEKRTLQEILRVTMLGELKEKAIDDYFGYILGSAILKVDEKLLRDLSARKSVKVPDTEVVVMSQDSSGMSQQADTIYVEGSVGTSASAATPVKSTPDYLLSYGEHWLVIDTYNGSILKRIMEKLSEHSKTFPKAQIVVFASGGGSAAHTSLGETFSLYSMKCPSGDPTVINSIEFGDMVIDLRDVCATYFLQFHIFTSEVIYWLECSRAQKIIRTEEVNILM